MKPGADEIDEGAEHLCEIERLTGKHNEKEEQMQIRPRGLTEFERKLRWSSTGCMVNPVCTPSFSTILAI